MGIFNYLFKYPERKKQIKCPHLWDAEYFMDDEEKKRVIEHINKHSEIPSVSHHRVRVNKDTKCKECGILYFDYEKTRSEFR